MTAKSTLLFLTCIAGISFVHAQGQTCLMAGETFCKSCSTFVLCDANLDQLSLPCGTGKICGNSTSSAGCYPVTETSQECACNATAAAPPSQLADPFDPTKYQICVAPGLQFEQSCSAGEIYDDVTAKCIVGPTQAPTTAAPTLDCTGKTAGLQIVPPECTSYYGCFQDPANTNQLTSYGPYTCPTAGNVFTGSACEDPAALLASVEPFQCDSASTVTGAVMDSVECNAFQICMAGSAEPIGVKQCCTPGMRFDATLMNCVPASDIPDSACPTINCIDPAKLSFNCSESITTTPLSTSPSSLSSSPSGSSSSSSGASSSMGSSSITSSSMGSSSITSSSMGSSSSTSSSGSSSSSTLTTQSTTTTGGTPSCAKDGAVPYPRDCTKYYWCSNGKYTLQRCPSQLLFNKEKGYCDMAANVSGC